MRIANSCRGKKLKTALILGRRNGAGLDRDSELLSEVLNECGVLVKVPRLKNIFDGLSREHVAEAAFHLERVAPGWWLRKADRHILIPNQERFPKRLIARLERMDEIWCKSRHAEAVFSQLHRKVIYVGFTSKDRILSGAEPDYGTFFHLAGKSTMKNTSLLLELWRCHPEWPRLTVVQHPSNAPKQVPGNVNLIGRYLNDDELRRLQNCHGIHLCPSLSEGWGHYIAEALSCRALVVTTDAPPMNELVSADRGVLVPYSSSEPRHLGTVYRARPGDLEAVIEDLLVMPGEVKRHLGEAARAWFEENSRNFKARVIGAIAPDGG